MHSALEVSQKSAVNFRKQFARAYRFHKNEQHCWQAQGTFSVKADSHGAKFPARGIHAFAGSIRRHPHFVGESKEHCTSEQVVEAIPGFDALITGWGTPVLTLAVFERTNALGISAYSAGTAKRTLLKCARDYVMPRGICVFNAYRATAFNVAEHTIGLMIVTSRKIFDHALAFARGKKMA